MSTKNPDMPKIALGAWAWENDGTSEIVSVCGKKEIKCSRRCI